jgi:endo-alpha-1,4-polygalactosaminidase (GH114 family)
MTDSVNFVRKMASTANAYGMAMGLKNAQDIIPSVQQYVQFAVNEECAANQECESYMPMLQAGKPVFHIEYGDASQAYEFCLRSMSGGNYFSTVIKTMNLDGWVAYCDGSSATSPTM